MNDRVGLRKISKCRSNMFHTGTFWNAYWAMQDLENYLNLSSNYYPLGRFWEAMRAMQDLEKVLNRQSKYFPH